VRTKSGAQGWQSDPLERDFPPELGVTVFRTNAQLAGYDASIRYYFQNDRFFQATADFDFNDLKNFDFNYNVFRSVNEYYTAIRTRTFCSLMTYMICCAVNTAARSRCSGGSTRDLHSWS
jgi:hypothetical protein